MKLNPSQQQAVLHKDGPMLVLAGPGSGKTLVITERTKHLIQEYKIPEDNILVITFTRAAAQEMKERFLKGMGKNQTRVNFGTFHAVFFTILKHAYHLNAGNIARDEIRHQILREVIAKQDFIYTDEKEFISDLFSEISLVKGNQVDISNYYAIHCPDEIFRNVYREYNQRLRKANLIDFDDILLLCHQLLASRRDILSLWQNKFQYILIDEFQDINKIQYDIVRLLGETKNNIFAVGDDDQSIYRFRGAKPEIMLAYPKDFPGCRTVVLDKNYRSTSNIVKASKCLIQHNKHRFHKEVSAMKNKGSNINILCFESLSQQNQMLADEIHRLNQRGISYADMAILVRTNMGSGALLYKLMEYNIPFHMRDSVPNIYEHWIATDLLSYIKIAMGDNHRNLYLQIMNRPIRYISRECFDTVLVDLEAIKDYYEDKNWMLERLEQLEYDLSILSRLNPYAAINYIRRGIGYEAFLKEYAIQRKIKVEELMDILDELQENARQFKSYEDWFAHMENYKEELKRQVAEQKKNKDSVTIATMHSAKGLEFQFVFIADANEGITPHKKAALEEDLEEERRLFYVAVTRAKESLYILSSKERYNKVMEPSRFIRELDIDKDCEK